MTEEEIKLIEVPFQKVSVKPGDVIVVMTEMVLSKEAMANIRQSLKPIFPDNEITVMEEGMKIGVMAKSEDAS